MAYKPQAGSQMAPPNVIPMSDIMLVILVIYLGNTRIQKEESTRQIKNRISTRLDKTVYVKSDARAKYGRVVEVVDEIRSAGVDQLGLLTQKNQNTKSTPPPPPAD